MKLAARSVACVLLLLPACATAPTTSRPRSAVGPPIGEAAPHVGRSAEDRARATEPEAEPWKEFSVSLGGVLAAVNSSARLGTSGLGLELSLEDLLGYDSGTTSVRFEGGWRFSENRRHRVSVGYLDLSRDSSLITQRDIDLGGGNVIPSGTGVRSDFGLRLIKTEYSYSFFQDDRVDLAAAAGLYVAPIEFGVEAAGGGSFQGDFDVTAPLPLFGLRADFAITPRWYLRNRLNLFYLEVGDYAGSITDASTAVEYKGWDHFAVGLGLDNFAVAVEQNGSTDVPGVDSRGRADFRYFGVALYLKGLW